MKSTQPASQQAAKTVAQCIKQLSDPSYINQVAQSAAVFDEYIAAKERLATWVAADPRDTPTEIAFRDEQLAKAQQNLDAVEAKYQIFRNDFGTPNQATLPPISPINNLPPPLTTSNIAHTFVGLRWKTEAAWKKPLGNKPKWLHHCIAIPGSRGVSETRWNPVLIGAALVHDGQVKANSVRSKFQTQPLLQPWLEAWKAYEADNFSDQ